MEVGCVCEREMWQKAHCPTSKVSLKDVVKDHMEFVTGSQN